MAPEQVEGKEVDARTDIFAYGAVVYEMATGKRAFEGKSQASLMVAILEREPPAMSSLQPMTPPALDRVVKKCLAKEPDKRWQTASDVCDELKWIAEGGSQVTLAPTAAVKGIRALGRRALILGLGALLLVAAASLTTWNLKPSPPQPVTRTVINLPPGQQLAGLENGPAVALSPDGTHLAYVARQSGTQQLYLRAMDSLEARPVPGTEGAVGPFFSPDGRPTHERTAPTGLDRAARRVSQEKWHVQCQSVVANDTRGYFLGHARGLMARPEPGAGCSPFTREAAATILARARIEIAVDGAGR
jgi:hypothetical protein